MTCSSSLFFEEWNRTQLVIAAGTGATPAAFNLGLCRLRSVLSPPAPHDHAAGGPFFVATTTTAGGTVLLCDEENLNRTQFVIAAGAGATPAAFLLRIMPPSWHPVPACAPRPCCRRAVLRCDYDHCRWNCSTLRRRKLESGAVRCSRSMWRLNVAAEQVPLWRLLT